MSNYHRASTTGATYFFTLVSYQRHPILCDKPVRNALRAAIEKTRAERPFQIDAWVLMPDHLHCIWTLPADDADFSTRWSMIKRRVSQACRDYRRDGLLTASRLRRRESTIWQGRYWEHQIRDPADFAQHVDYIHYNPVKHGFVACASDWPYSTLQRDIARGIHPVDWAGATACSAVVTARE